MTKGQKEKRKKKRQSYEIRTVKESGISHRTAYVWLVE